MEPRRLLPVACLVTALAVVASACSFPHIRREEPRIPPLPQTSLVLDDRGHLITALHAGINRTLIPISQMPVVLRDAVVAAEDQRFYEHHGVDVKAIIRAAVQDAKSGRIVQGGSTITEQLVKNTITGDDRTLSRKIHEALLANQLENEHSKNWILQQYLNTVYFGQGAYGIQAAAETYFSEPASELTLPQAATLAGIIASPSRWDPVLNPTAASARRDQVLTTMAGQGMITKGQEAAAATQGLGLRIAHTTGRYPAPYFVDYVKRWFLANPDFGASRDERYRKLFEGGLRIYTTVDLRLQRMAERAVNSILSYRKDPYGAMTVVDPRTGAIRAMVGGRDFFSRRNPFAQVNLATGQGGTGRQSGSSFKPFALVTALENGFQPSRVYPAPSHIDIPLPPNSVPPVWPVDNFEGGGGGFMTLEDATIHSVNTVYAQVVRDLGGGNAFLGAAKVVHTAYDMGFPQGSLHAYPSAVLGTNDVTTLEMASAFGTLATLGKRLPPMAVTKITDSSGKVIWQADSQPVQAVLPAVAWTADQILEKVIQQGTGIAAGIPRPAAGKTGTAQDYHDAWFVGFIPQMVAAVWVGFPQGQIDMSYPRVRIPHVLGGTWPAEIWHAFMVNATRHLPVLGFPRPTVDRVTEVVDVTRNCLPNQWTLPTDEQSVQFILGTQPTLTCSEPNGPQQVALPSVVGLSQDEATRELQAYHFLVTVTTQPSNATTGTVLSQEPPAGSVALQGTAVTITVASPAPTPSPTPSGTKVPDVVGMLRADALTALQKAGFAVKVVVQWECDPPDSCGAQADVVWKEDPAAGVVAGQGTTVTIWANKPTA